MNTAPHVRFADEDTYDRLHLSESDQYLVAGEGDTFELVNVLSPRFEGWFLTKFQVLPSVGFVGLTKQGGVIASPLEGNTWARLAALSKAAAHLAASETAVARRAEVAGAVGFLDAMFALPDTRPESGAAHA